MEEINAYIIIFVLITGFLVGIIVGTCLERIKCEEDITYLRGMWSDAYDTCEDENKKLKEEITVEKET